VSDRDERLLDAFLEDLGSAPVPEELAQSVTRRIRDQQPERQRNFAPWLVIAAAVAVVVALAGVAAIAAGPSPVPSLASVASLPAPSSPVATASPIPSASSGQMLPPGTPVPSDTPPPSSSPASLTGVVSWRLRLTGTGAKAVIGLVRDESGLLAGVSPMTDVGAARGASVGPGSDANSVVVQTAVASCTQWVSITVASDGRSIDLVPTKSPGPCFGVAGTVAAELHFKAPVSAAAMTATLRPYQFYTAVVETFVMAVAQGAEQELFVGGLDSGAVVATSTDGGAVWTSQHLGDGQVNALGVGGDGAVWVSVSCSTAEWDHCGRGVYRADVGNGGLAAARRVLSVQPVALAVDGQAIAALDQPDVSDRGGSLAWPPRSLWLSEDGGATWTTPTLPCESQSSYATSISFDQARRLVVLCEEGGATGSARKHLFRSDDPPTGTWTAMPDPPEAGTSMTLELTADGSGWLFGDRSPLLVTSDGGASWTANAKVADGDARIVKAGQAWPSAGGLADVYDRDRSALLLLRTFDGSAWTELAEFPDPPCCGG
jgi:hypothetical protein